MQALQQAVHLHQQGRWQQAMSLYKDVLKAQPKNPDALHLLGLLEAQHESFDKGTARMKKAFKLAPNNSQILNNLANLYSNEGRHKEAIDLYDKALLLDPMNLGAQENKGYALYNIHDYDAAVSVLKGLIGISKSPKLFAYLGACYLRLNKPEQAETTFNTGLSLNVPHVDLFIEAGRFYEQNNKLLQAEALYSKAIALDAEPDKAWSAYAACLLRSRNYQKAIPALKKVIDLGADTDGFAHANIGYCYQQLENLEDAEVWYKKALEEFPECPIAYAHYGTYQAVHGNMDEAKKLTEKATELSPNDSVAFYTYSSVHKFTEPHTNTAHYEALAWSPRTMIDDTIRLSFALSKMYWDLKEDEKSFVHLARGNALMYEGLNYDLDRDLKAIDNLAPVYEEEYLNTPLEVEKSRQTPIFLVGMPRSGTTLTEQILGAHPDVYPAGELPQLLDFVNKELGGTNDLGMLGAIYKDDTKLKAFREHYLSHLKEITDKPFVVDKMPHNFMLLGLIKRAFPEAKIIHCSRDAVATCFSCLRQMFSRKHHYSYNMEALGTYYKSYADYMNTMSPKLPDMYESSYDKLVESPEECTRRLVEAAGLPWDDACLSPHENKGKVLTASFVQARAPIHAGSKQSWKRVEKHLRPLIEALEK